MISPTLVHINNKLMEYDEKYGEVYPKFKAVELSYMSTLFRINLEVYSQYSSQPARDSAAGLRIEQEFKDFENYHALLTEVTLLERKMKNLTTISMNLKAMQWEIAR